MFMTGRQKLEMRVSRLLANASLAMEGKTDFLCDAPVITLKQAAVLAKRDVLGVYEKHVRHDFCSALRRHQSRQLRAYASNCRHHARVLRKLIKDYVEMPGTSL